MKKLLKNMAVLFVGYTAFQPVAFAAKSPWSIGVGASYSPAVYRGTPTNRMVIPILGYEGEHFFMRGFGMGYRINPQGSTHNLVIRAIYDPRTFKPGDSDIEEMKLLDERDDTVLAGLSYQYSTLFGMLETSVGADVLGVHNGVYGEVAWRLPLRFKNAGITPAFGYSYNDNKLNQHLYGVSQAESNRTNGRINAFDINGSGQFFVGLSAYYVIADQLTVNGGVRYTNLEGGIENSPVLDSTEATTATIGITYSF
ncbi:MipA/OmpV family protein [Vibrio ziniensis]|uniref:MipA/OmpV family protein n=1 Tax=Vibrio ziniensis TaxID=2711221 RepID=A0A6G7CPM5_9VIBR|nr:MipA/OmpV family protein [Vibrio ziniensis]